MTAGYELGRSAATGGASLLDLVQVHHWILGEVLAGTPSPDTTQEVLEAACEDFSEVPSTFDLGPGRAAPRRRMTGGTAQDPELARRSRASMTVSAMSMS
jgi:hypothetical protein